MPVSWDLQTPAARAQAWSPNGWGQDAESHRFPSAAAHLAPQPTAAVREGTGQRLSAGLRERAQLPEKLVRNTS